jgi:deoxyribonuclease V
MILPDISTEILYPENISAMVKIQKTLAEKIILSEDYHKIQIIAGVDVSNNLYDPGQMVYAAVVNLSYETLEIMEIANAANKQSLAYQPGFLGFREVPIILEVFKKLQIQPDLLLVDGHGISHPRRFGIASHLGVLLDIPTIGVAKSILVGKPQTELGDNVGDHTPLIWQGKIIGMLLRTKKRANPLIISTGHRVSLKTSIEIVSHCLKKYRLPEPTRYAHQAANACRISLTTPSTSTTPSLLLETSQYL